MTGCAIEQPAASRSCPIAARSGEPIVSVVERSSPFNEGDRPCRHLQQVRERKHCPREECDGSAYQEDANRKQETDQQKECNVSDETPHGRRRMAGSQSPTRRGPPSSGIRADAADACFWSVLLRRTVMKFRIRRRRRIVRFRSL